MADQLVGNLHIATRADQLDAEQLREFERSRAWELIRNKIVGMLGDRCRTLEDSDLHDDIMRAQGAAAALRRVLDLPGIIREEAKRERKAG